MSDEPSGFLAQLALMLGVAGLWTAFGYGCWRIVRGWRP